MLRNLMTASCLLLAVATQAAWAGEAGRVVFVTGQSQLASRPAAVDAVVSEGDEISTGTDGYVYIKTVDAGFLILRPNSKARVTAYHIDPANPANNKVKLELISGVARAISGQGVKQARQNFRFNTPVAAIGVRGTDFIVYTDDHTSRVSVVSGGVVMAGFGAACKADGVGPCEGSASRELFAGQAGMLLQIQRGQVAPQLLNNPALSPDQSEHPRSDEPVGKVTTASTISSSQVNLDAQKGDLLGAVRPATPEVPPPVTPTPPAPEPVPLPPKDNEVFWGRWSVVAGQAVLPAAVKNQNVDTPVFVGEYVIARLKGAEVVLPQDGTVAFTLDKGDASVQRGGTTTRASVDGGTLGIDFAKRTFDTGLNVTNGGTTYRVNGTGLVDYRGYLQSTSSSPSEIRGYLSGAHVEEAAYIFRNTETPGLTIIGGTTWKR